MVGSSVTGGAVPWGLSDFQSSYIYPFSVPPKADIPVAVPMRQTALDDRVHRGTTGLRNVQETEIPWPWGPKPLDTSHGEVNQIPTAAGPNFADGNRTDE